MAKKITITDTMLQIGKQAKQAGRILAASPGSQRNIAITLMRDNLVTIKPQLIKANQADVEDAKQSGLSQPLVKRLTISEKVFQYMLSRIISLIDLEDPVGRVISGHTNAGGLCVRKISVPLGVIGIIYESGRM